jgi:hypothetical protein
VCAGGREEEVGKCEQPETPINNADAILLSSTVLHTNKLCASKNM